MWLIDAQDDDGSTCNFAIRLYVGRKTEATVPVLALNATGLTAEKNDPKG